MDEYDEGDGGGWVLLIVIFVLLMMCLPHITIIIK